MLHWSPTIGKLRMTPLSFVKTMESYVKTKEPYKVSQLGHHVGSAFAGQDLITASEQNVRAVNNCNSWLHYNSYILAPINLKLPNKQDSPISARGPDF